MGIRWPMVWSGACLSFALLATACGTERLYFRPTDNVVEVPGRGYLAIASYQLEDASCRPIGTVRLDSQGIFEAEFVPSDGSQTVLGIELTITNTSENRFVLLPDEQTVENLNGVPKLFPYLVYVDGVRSQQIEVPPDSARQIDLLYRVPPKTDLGRLEDFLFHWHVQVADSLEQVEFTHFVRMPATSYYYPAYDYAGYWNGYFFPGHFAIPEWALGIYFAPPIFPYYETYPYPWGYGGAHRHYAPDLPPPPPPHRAAPAGPPHPRPGQQPDQKQPRPPVPGKEPVAGPSQPVPGTPAPEEPPPAGGPRIEKPAAPPPAEEPPPADAPRVEKPAAEPPQPAAPPEAAPPPASEPGKQPPPSHPPPQRPADEEQGSPHPGPHKGSGG